MRIKYWTGLALCALALFINTHSLHAHRLKHIFTTVEMNAENQLEVVHQVHLHDASVALSLIQDMRETDVLDLEGQARLLLHVQDFFVISAEDTPIPLDIVGSEIEGNHLFLYFESGQIDTPHRLTIKNEMFMDLFGDQQNLMNLTVGGHLKSLRFPKKGEPKTAVFTQ